MSSSKLYMLLLGCRPAGRSIEQHDVFFGIGASLREMIPAIIESWPEAKEKIHVDAWREVNYVNGYRVSIKSNAERIDAVKNVKLFFINLGGYKQHEFEEFHYKMIIAAADRGAAISQAKQTAFYRHTGFTGATSHVDDKYGVDVDDLYEIKDILLQRYKEQFSIHLTPDATLPEDEIHLGYFKLDNL